MQSRFCRRPPCGGSQPIGQRSRLLVCRRTVWWCQNSPVARPSTAFRRVMGLLVRGERKAKERSSPVCSTSDQIHLSDERGCRTAGCERGFMPWQVATRLQKARDRSAADTVRDRCRRNWHSTSMRVQAARLRLGRRDCVAVKLLSTQIVRNRRKQFSSSTTRHVACNVVVNAFQQYEGLVNLATAKVERRRLIFALA